MRRPWQLAAAVVIGLQALLALAACATTTDYMRERPVRAVPHLPSARVDVEASELDLRSEGTPSLPNPTMRTDYSGDVLRKEVAVGLDEGLLGGAGIPQPARFRIRASYERKIWPMFACLVVLTYVGCPFSKGDVELDMDLDIGKRRYFAHASESVYTGVFYNQEEVKAALARGIQSAFRKIVEEAKAQVVTSAAPGSTGTR